MTTTNTYTNDSTLLRDFDLEAAKAGKPIQLRNIDTPITFIACGKESVFINVGESELIKHIVSVKMKPLFWLEGKPVYVGDTVYHVAAGKGTTTDKKNSWGEYMVLFESTPRLGASGCIISNLSLSPFPPVKQERKGWINIWKQAGAIGAASGCTVYNTKEDALLLLEDMTCLIDTVEITWME